MKTTPLRAGWMALPLFCAFALVSAQSSSNLKPLVYEGCFKSSADMTNLGSYTYQSPGYCQQQCVNQSKPVMGTTMGSNCWCGDLLPASSSKVSDSECSSKCNGYNLDTCGGPNAWSVQLTGLSNNVASESSRSGLSSDTSSDSNESLASSSLASAAASPTEKGPPSVVTKASTIIVTAFGQTTPQKTIITTTQALSSAGPNKASIAAGVVVGIVSLSAIAGGIFFFLRNRRRRAVDEEYRRNIAGDYSAKPPTSSAGSLSDARLEPSVMMQRRQSDGSIADNKDYSRRILKLRTLTVLDIAGWSSITTTASVLSQRSVGNLSRMNSPLHTSSRTTGLFHSGLRRPGSCETKVRGSAYTSIVESSHEKGLRDSNDL